MTDHDHDEHRPCPACHTASCRRIVVLDATLIFSILLFTTVVALHWATS
jgi:hypothetical protein